MDGFWSHRGGMKKIWVSGLVWIGSWSVGQVEPQIDLRGNVSLAFVVAAEQTQTVADLKQDRLHVVCQDAKDLLQKIYPHFPWKRLDLFRNRIEFVEPIPIGEKQFVKFYKGAQNLRLLE